MKRRLRLACTLLAFVPALACGTNDSAVDDAGCIGGKCDDADDAPAADGSRMCVALRGNGPLITAHFGAMSSIIERHGLPGGVAGGSSGSITTFLAESIHANPLVRDCGDSPGTTTQCSEQESRARAALLYKSLLGYVEALGDTGEGVALRSLTALQGASESLPQGDIDTLNDENATNETKKNAFERIRDAVAMQSQPSKLQAS